MCRVIETATCRSQLQRIRATTISRPTLSTSTWATGTSVFVAASPDWRSKSSNPTFHPLSKAASSQCQIWSRPLWARWPYRPCEGDGSSLARRRCAHPLLSPDVSASGPSQLPSCAMDSHSLAVGLIVPAIRSMRHVASGVSQTEAHPPAAH
jgi:hypothetical protein